MKRLLLSLILIFPLLTYAQYVVVDSQNYTPQQLIEDILIDSDCIENIVVTNVVGGNFNGADQSYGYFDASGTTFPFESGVVLSTGRLQNVEGPNTTLSDDDAPNWVGDSDLENALNETGTLNATILEFEFTSVASQISFRYIFASEEYQEGNPNSCQYSDLFGFLIRPATGQNQYENIALVPDTFTPVKATTVTPGVPGTCPPQNETYFGMYNGPEAPINFNGQTAVLTATANVIPNETYQVKLVIADEQNYRYDSAVFLEAASFQLSTDLGPNRLIATGNALCEGETLELSPVQQYDSSSYDWFKDGVLVESTPSTCSNCGTYTVSEPGTYTLEVGLDNDCIAYGAVVIEYAPLPTGINGVLVECDVDQDGLTTYNLFDAASDLFTDDSSFVSSFYLNEEDARANENPIANPTSFNNEFPFQTVYARVVNPANCFSISELELQTSNNIVNIPDLEACDGDIIDGFADFPLNEISESIQNQIPTDATVSYFETEEDAFNETNALSNTYENTSVNSQTIFVKINSNNQCFSITTVNLVVLYTPVLQPDETVFYCSNTFPETLRIYGGVLNDLPNNYYYEWLFNGVPTAVNTTFNEVNEPGIYTVIVRDPNGCSSSRTITVSPSSTAIIENVSVEGISNNNTVTISVSGEGNYEYALDDSEGVYQDSNVFTNLSRGFHTVYVRDTNGCGLVEELISVLGFPKFFTPNNDGDNDTWRVIGSNSQFNLIKSVEIYNRYGKLITVQTTLSGGWDGTLNGSRLPSDDYWFIARFIDGKQYVGHFALRR